MTFEQWMKKVDRAMTLICGLVSADLVDYAYRDVFEDGVTPEEVAFAALEAGGYDPEPALDDFLTGGW